MAKIIASFCATLVLVSVALSADDKAEFRAFMIANVGKTVSLSGKLEEGKDSPFVVVRGGHVHLKFEFDEKLMNKNVTATGTLRYREKLNNPPGTSAVPEMFYLEDGKAAVSPAKAP